MVDADDRRRDATCLDDHSKEPQQLRQLSDDGGDAPGLVARGEVRRRGRRPDPPRAVGLPPQQLRQLGDVGDDAPRLVAAEQLGGRASTGAAELFSQKAKPPLTIPEHL
jgi:hypothetical protein